MMDYLWLRTLCGKTNEGYGMRTIKFQSLYKETEYIIKSGEQKITYFQ